MHSAHDVIDGQRRFGVQRQWRFHVGVGQSGVEHRIGYSIFDPRQLNDLVGGGETLTAVDQSVCAGCRFRAIAEVNIEGHEITFEHRTDASAVAEIETAANVVCKLIGVGKVRRLRIIMAQQTCAERLTQRNGQSAIVSIALYQRLRSGLIENTVADGLAFRLSGRQQQLAHVGLRAVVHYFAERARRIHFPHRHLLGGKRIAEIFPMIDIEETRVGHGLSVCSDHHFIEVGQSESFGHVELRHEIVACARTGLGIDHGAQPTAVGTRHRRSGAHGAGADREMQLRCAHRILARHHVDAQIRHGFVTT